MTLEICGYSFEVSETSTNEYRFSCDGATKSSIVNFYRASG